MTDPRALRGLVERARHGALATVAREPAGWPFATLVAVAFDERARPLLLLSRLAEHTQNLEACASASLLVVDPEGAATGDPMAAGRMTLVGSCARVADGEQAAVRAAFVRAHPEASGYARFADFAAYRMEVTAARWVGGFGRMAWVDGGAYTAACAGGE